MLTYPAARGVHNTWHGGHVLLSKSPRTASSEGGALGRFCLVQKEATIRREKRTYVGALTMLSLRTEWLDGFVPPTHVLLYSLWR